MQQPDPRREREADVLRRRYLTPAGTGVAKAVANGATTAAIVFLREEQDTNYGVHVTPTWSTTVFVTGKTTTGFTANFGSAAGATDKIDWSVFRMES